MSSIRSATTAAKVTRTTATVDSSRWQEEFYWSSFRAALIYVARNVEIQHHSLPNGLGQDEELDLLFDHRPINRNLLQVAKGRGGRLQDPPSYLHEPPDPPMMTVAAVTETKTTPKTTPLSLEIPRTSSSISFQECMDEDAFVSCSNIKLSATKTCSAQFQCTKAQQTLGKCKCKQVIDHEQEYDRPDFTNYVHHLPSVSNSSFEQENIDCSCMYSTPLDSCHNEGSDSFSCWSDRIQHSNNPFLIRDGKSIVSSSSSSSSPCQTVENVHLIFKTMQLQSDLTELKVRLALVKAERDEMEFELFQLRGNSSKYGIR